VHTITYDLRPPALLAPIFALSFISIHYQKANWQKIILFGCIFLIREEGLIFGLILILYNYFSIENRKPRLTTTGWLSLAWLAAVLITISYFNWADYSFDELRSPLYLLSTNQTAIISAVFVGLIIVGLTWRHWNTNWKSKNIRFIKQLATFGLLVVPLGIQLKIEISNWDVGPGNFFSNIVPNILLKPYVNLFVIIFLMFLVLIWSGLAEKARKTLVTGLLIFAIFITGYNLTAIYDQLDSYERDSAKAEIVFDVRTMGDYLSTAVMADYATYQVFYDYEKLYVYNRLSSHLIEKRKDRYFPRNTAVVEKLLMEEIEYIVISQRSVSDIVELLDRNQIEILETTENKAYIIYQIR